MNRSLQSNHCKSLQYYDILYLFVSFTALCLGFIGYSHFLQIDYFNLPAGTYNTGSGYTLDAFVWFVLATWLQPVGLIFLVIFIFHFNKRDYWSNLFKLLVNTALLSTSISSCVYSYLKAKSVLECGLFCWTNEFTASSKPDQPYNATGQILVFTIYFFVTLILSLCLAALCVRQVAVLCLGQNKNVYDLVHGSRSVSSTDESQCGPETDDSTERLLPTETNHHNISLIEALDGAKLVTAIRKREYDYTVRDAPENASRTRISISLVVVFGIMYPLIILGCTSLPTSLPYYSKLVPATTVSYFKYEPDATITGYFWRIPINFQTIGRAEVQGTLKIFPDILLYYGTIYIVSLIALLSQVYRPLAQALSYRLSLRAVRSLYPTVLTRWKICPLEASISVGELLLGIIFAGLITAEFLYWYLNHGWQDKTMDTYSAEERAARSMGQVMNAIVGLLLLPVSRNSVWSIVFVVSWEAMIRFHTWMGTLLFVCILCHVGLFWKMLDQKGDFPHDIFSIPTQYHSNNFTIPLTTLSTGLALLCIGVCSYYPVRRYCYELFYWPHHFAVIMLLVMLWHATFCWYYITGGLVLWAVDHCIRLHRRVGLAVESVTAEIVNKENISTVAEADTKYAYTHPGSVPSILHLRYQVRPPLNLTKLFSAPIISFFRETMKRCGWTLANANIAHDEADCRFVFQPGQYVFLNVPAVSELAWHPFSISSAPDDPLISHHIRSMGESQWTGRFATLVADNLSRQRQHLISSGTRRPESSPLNLCINIDGPYGVPLRYQCYDNILLCAGGIGITPAHSLFRSLLHRWARRRPDTMHIKTVRLVWATRSWRVAEMFQNTWDSLQNIAKSHYQGVAGMDEAALFSVSIHITSPHARPDAPFQRSDLEKDGADGLNSDAFDHKSGCFCVSTTRPDFNQEVRAMARRARPIVFACGPSALVDTVDFACTEHRVEFQKEVFLL